MKCSIADCDRHARRRPVIVLRSSRSPKPTRAMLNIGMCDPHAKERDLSDFLNPRGWSKLVHETTAATGVAPEKNLTTLEWSRIK